MNTVTYSPDKLTELHRSEMGNVVTEVCVWIVCVCAASHGAHNRHLEHQDMLIHATLKCFEMHENDCFENRSDILYAG